MRTIQGAENHPCYNEEASKKYGRMHLPVAPKCNISCNYCNRKFDCANECRPGVTSRVLSADEAFEIFEMGVRQRPYITTLGIAGPGDSLANPDATFALLEKVHTNYPDVNLCISTNGLLLPDYAEELMKLNARFITVTVNATQAVTASKIYRAVRYNGKTYRGEEGASILLERQKEGIAKAVRLGATIKINSVYIPEVNANEILSLADLTKEMGVHLMNVTPLIPVEGSKMEHFRKPSELEMDSTRAVISGTMELMEHCSQCRSDACGLLSEKENSVHKIKPEEKHRKAKETMRSGIDVETYAGSCL